MFEAEVNPLGIKSAEVVVCIPSYNEAPNIAFPLLKADEGLCEYFKGAKAVIINCDNDSQDGTKEVFLGTETEVPKIYLSTPPGVKGKGNNLKNLFKKVLDLKAEVIMVVDADLKSITPQWINRLGEPLTRDFGFVTPLYVRHKYDGTITNAIAYPLTRALYGRRVRQPIGGDFGFSGRLAEIYLGANTWDEAVSQFGIDIWMTTVAMNKGIPICQAFMGRPKIHKAKDPGTELSLMFRQAVGTIFRMMIKTAPFWKSVKWSKPTAIFGFGLGEVEMPPTVEVNGHMLHHRFIEGFEVYLKLWHQALSAEVVRKLMEIRDLDNARFDFPTLVWIRVLYDLAVAFQKTPPEKTDALLDSLIPLYFGKTLSFVKKTERMSIQEAEEVVENEASLFEESKPYLVENWPG